AAPAATAARAVPEVPAEVPECSASQVSTVRAVPGPGRCRRRWRRGWRRGSWDSRRGQPR
ncbi:hypothetical protein TMHG_02649, partial [Mycobacterium tuberculosis SUMu008]